MSLKDHINNLPNQRLDMIQELAEITCSSVNAVYRWMSGASIPAPLKQKVISKHLGKSVEELFPEGKKKAKKKTNNRHSYSSH